MSQPPLHDLLLVVPCFNEAERLDAARFEAAVECYAGLRLLFVNDGSTDDTQQVLEALASRHPARVAVRRLAQNEGKAEAVRQGLLEAVGQRAAWTGFWDADLATPLSALDEFAAAVTRMPSVRAVIGSRVKLLGRDIERNPVRHLLGRVFATAASLTLDLPIYDTQCGAKLFAVNETLAEALRERFASRWIFDVELLQRLDAAWLRADGQRAHAYLLEVPLLAWQDVRGSRVRSSDFLRAGAELAVIRSRRRQG